MDSHRGNNYKKQRLDRRIVNQLARSVGRRGIDRLLCRLLFNRVQLLLGHCLPPLHLLYSCLVTYSDSFTGRAATLKNWSRHQTNWLWFMESSTARGRVRASYRQAGRQCTTTTRSSSLSPTSKRADFYSGGDHCGRPKKCRLSTTNTREDSCTRGYIGIVGSLRITTLLEGDKNSIIDLVDRAQRDLGVELNCGQKSTLSPTQFNK